MSLQAPGGNQSSDQSGPAPTSYRLVWRDLRHQLAHVPSHGIGEIVGVEDVDADTPTLATVRLFADDGPERVTLPVDDLRMRTSGGGEP